MYLCYGRLSKGRGPPQIQQGPTQRALNITYPFGTFEISSYYLRAHLHETRSEHKPVSSFTSVVNLALIHCQFFGSVHMNSDEVTCTPL